MPEDGLTKEEEHYAINRIIKKFQKSSKLYAISEQKV